MNVKIIKVINDEEKKKITRAVLERQLLVIYKHL